MWWCLWLLHASLFASTTHASSASESASDLLHAVPATSNSIHHMLSRARQNGDGGPTINNLKMILERRPTPANGRLNHYKSTSWGTLASRSDILEEGALEQRSEVTKPNPIDKREYGFSVVSAIPPKQSNSIPVHQDGTDYSYFTTVALGTGGKTMYMLVDTGGTNAWVMGSSCKSEACNIHHTFGSEDSTTLKRTGAGFTIGYGTGVVSGELVNDTVVMGGLSLSTTFGLANNVSDEFSVFPADGILALGRPESGNFGYTTIMETLIQSKLLESNVIGINLQRASDGTADGELNFGSPDTTKYTGELVYVNTVPENNAWEISIDDIVVDGVACNFTGETSFIDTGTSFLLFSTQDAQRIHRLIPGSQQVGDAFQLPCDSDFLFQIKISGIAFSVSAKDYVGKPIQGGDFCASNIIGGQDIAKKKWVLGDVFLKNVYTVLDFDKDRIGFGAKAASVPLKPSSTISTVASSASGAESTAKASSAPSSLSIPPPSGLSLSPSSQTSIPEISGGAQSTTSITQVRNGSSNLIPHLSIFGFVLPLGLLLLLLL